MAENDSVFEIGLAMAGAISAGAYSAGVMDFLFQALEEWERVKREAPGTVPNHSVCIRAISGASAGSITGALSAFAVSGGLRKTAFEQPAPGTQAYKCVLPSLHEAWVALPDMASTTGADDLLSNNDLEPGKPPSSLLNAKILDKLTDQALQLPADAKGPASGGPGLPYFAERLHLYLTLSNMRGVPYKVNFTTGETIGAHFMMSHGDRAHFILENIGTHGQENAWLKRDPGLEIPITSASRNGVQTTETNWRSYGRAALASAAFPVGLAARQIDTHTTQYLNRSWPDYPISNGQLAPDWPPTRPEADYEIAFMSVDGGLIDNEPFEYVRQAILRQGYAANPPEGEKAFGAVVMIDPFPEPPEFPDDTKALDGSLLSVVGSLLPITSVRQVS